MAARALHQTLAMGAAGGVAGLAAVLELAPAPSAHAAEEAALPPVDGGWQPGARLQTAAWRLACSGSSRLASLVQLLACSPDAPACV